MSPFQQPRDVVTEAPTGMKLKMLENRCTGCQLCQLTCSAIKSGSFNLILSRINILDKVDGRKKIIVCHQCKKCKCVEACNYNAFKKNNETGNVYVDQDECQACLACIEACPFHAVRLDNVNKTPMVCDLCGGRPSCVDACPSGALAVTGAHNKI